MAKNQKNILSNIIPKDTTKERIILRFWSG
jgi:hypothetical protein